MINRIKDLMKKADNMHEYLENFIRKTETQFSLLDNSKPSKWVEWKSFSCVRLWEPMDYTVHGILQARILEWVAFPFSKGSSQPRDRTQVFCIAGGFFTSWATREAQLLVDLDLNFATTCGNLEKITVISDEKKKLIILPCRVSMKICKKNICNFYNEIWNLVDAT